MTNIFNTYDRTARLFPAIICSLPLVLIKFVIVDHYIDVNTTAKLLTFTVEGVSVWIVFVYFLAQINRFVAKTFFENKNDFPTHQMLLPSSAIISQSMRDKISIKVKSDFHVSLPDLHDEQTDLPETKTRIKEIVGMIIHKVGDGKLLLQHNAEYGFMRNLIGGSMIALVISLVSVFFFHWVLKNNTAFIISIVLSLCYLIPIVFSKPILRNYGKEYTSILFREYLA